MNASAKSERENVNIGKIIATAWTRYSFIFVFIIILIIYAITVALHGNTFRFSHITAILSSQNTVIVGIIALGMAMVIITGQIDLSVGSAMILCSGICIMVFNMTNSIALTLISAIAAGTLCGLINGILVGYAKMPPFIVTLGTMLIFIKHLNYIILHIFCHTSI